jgi:hypothetical protein
LPPASLQKIEMLKLLLDEHISRSVAEGLRRRRQLVVVCMAEWEDGKFLGQQDSDCLKQAAVEGLTLVTYDRRTIPPLLKSWAEQEQKHGGVIFVDEKTISPSDTGGLIEALSDLWRKTAKWDWSDRICFFAAFVSSVRHSPFCRDFRAGIQLQG